jgi:hypothetical protein
MQNVPNARNLNILLESDVRNALTKRGRPNKTGVCSNCHYHHDYKLKEKR